MAFNMNTTYEKAIKERNDCLTMYLAHFSYNSLVLDTYCTYYFPKYYCTHYIKNAHSDCLTAILGNGNANETKFLMIRLENTINSLNCFACYNIFSKQFVPFP